MYSPPEVIAACLELDNPLSRWSGPGMRDLYRTYIFHYATAIRHANFQFPIVFDDNVFICFRFPPDVIKLFCGDRSIDLHIHTDFVFRVACIYAHNRNLCVEIESVSKNLHETYTVSVDEIQNSINSGNMFIDATLKSDQALMIDGYPISSDHSVRRQGNKLYYAHDPTDQQQLGLGMHYYMTDDFCYTLNRFGYWGRAHGSTKEYLVGPNTWMK